MLICGVVFALAAGLLAYKAKTITSITGKITPGDAAELVWAVSGRDTVKTTPVPVMGSFSLEVKPGTYTLIIVAKPPYKSAQVDNVKVETEQTVDVGEINLAP
jgi:hypothetical protein